MTSAGPAPSAEAFGVAGIWLSYGSQLALRDVTLAVPAGQVTAVVGGDGAGKTSLLRCLSGVLRPDRGQVRAPGKQRTGYLPASSGVYPDLTVRENLAFRATAYRMAPAVAAQRSAELTELAGLTAAQDRLAVQLSGGMRQKLGVIAAMLPEPELLILDEPSTGVDPVSRSGLWRLIASAAARGAAVVLSTTYLDDAQRAATVLVLDGGVPLAAGRPEEIVAAMPGTVRALPAESAGEDRLRSWRRGTGWRVWVPPGTAAPGAPVQPDLQDAVTVAALAHETGSSHDREGLPGAGARKSFTPAQTRAVSRSFGGFTAVRDVSISIGPGEVVGLLGANGAGKTTLIRLLLGLVAPTQGEVDLFGAPPSRLTRRRIGYVPQSLGLYGDLTAAENRQFAAAVYGTGATRPDGEDAGPTAALPVGRLPLGLQRRAAFAEALAHQPDLLILDEPTSGVDPLGRARLWQTIRAAAAQGAGALVSTHYLEEAGECDRLVIMADGAVVAAGTIAQIIGDRTVTVVEAADWRAAFAALDKAGLPVSLAGQALRVPGVSIAETRRVLAAIPATVSSSPATLEERFYELATASTGRPHAGTAA